MYSSFHVAWKQVYQRAQNVIQPYQDFALCSLDATHYDLYLVENIPANYKTHPGSIIYYLPLKSCLSFPWAIWQTDYRWKVLIPGQIVQTVDQKIAIVVSTRLTEFRPLLLYLDIQKLQEPAISHWYHLSQLVILSSETKSLVTLDLPRSKQINLFSILKIREIPNHKEETWWSSAHQNTPLVNQIQVESNFYFANLTTSEGVLTDNHLLIPWSKIENWTFAPILYNKRKLCLLTQLFNPLSNQETQFKSIKLTTELQLLWFQHGHFGETDDSWIIDRPHVWVESSLKACHFFSEWLLTTVYDVLSPLSSLSLTWSRHGITANIATTASLSPDWKQWCEKNKSLLIQVQLEHLAYLPNATIAFLLYLLVGWKTTETLSCSFWNSFFECSSLYFQFLPWKTPLVDYVLQDESHSIIRSTETMVSIPPLAPVLSFVDLTANESPSFREDELNTTYAMYYPDPTYPDVCCIQVVKIGHMNVQKMLVSFIHPITQQYFKQVIPINFIMGWWSKHTPEEWQRIGLDAKQQIVLMTSFFPNCYECQQDLTDQDRVLKCVTCNLKFHMTCLERLKVIESDQKLMASHDLPRFTCQFCQPPSQSQVQDQSQAQIPQISILEDDPPSHGIRTFYPRSHEASDWLSSIWPKLNQKRLKTIMMDESPWFLQYWLYGLIINNQSYASLEHYFVSQRYLSNSDSILWSTLVKKKKNKTKLDLAQVNLKISTTIVNYIQFLPITELQICEKYLDTLYETPPPIITDPITIVTLLQEGIQHQFSWDQNPVLAALLIQSSPKLLQEEKEEKEMTRPNFLIPPHQYAAVLTQQRDFLIHNHHSPTLFGPTSLSQVTWLWVIRQRKIEFLLTVHTDTKASSYLAINRQGERQKIAWSDVLYQQQIEHFLPPFNPTELKVETLVQWIEPYQTGMWTVYEGTIETIINLHIVRVKLRQIYYLDFKLQSIQQEATTALKLVLAHWLFQPLSIINFSTLSHLPIFPWRGLANIAKNPAFRKAFISFFELKDG